MHQPKVGGRLSAYSVTSRNSGRCVVQSNRGHIVVVGIGWRVVVEIFILKSMHMQAVVHVIQAAAKTTLLQ